MTIGAASSGRTQADDFPDDPDVVIEKVGQDAVGIVVDTTNTRIIDINQTIAYGNYVAQRPLLYMWIPSKASHADIVADYIQFCLQPDNNQDFCDAVDYLSWYDLI